MICCHETESEKILDLDVDNPKSYIDVPYGENDEDYKNNIETRTKDWFDGTLRDLSSIRKSCYAKVQPSLYGLVNKARLAAGLPAIPYSEWETALKNLQKTDSEKYKQMFDPVAGVSAQQRAEGMMQPPADVPAQQAPANQAQQPPHTGMGGSLPGANARDEQGNWLNTNSVYKAYSLTPQQQLTPNGIYQLFMLLHKQPVHQQP